MYLAKVQVNNYRSIKSLTIGLDTGLNVLVGRNNTGKTNLLQAIRHALGPSASRGDSVWIEHEDFYRESQASEPEKTMSVTLTFAGLTEPQRAFFMEIMVWNLQDIDSSIATVTFEATWGTRQAIIRRWGGPPSGDRNEIPTSLLEHLPVTFLPALRDAEQALAPGYRSRLAILLREIAERTSSTTKKDFEAIFKKANEELEAQPLIKTTTTSLQQRMHSIAGTDYSPSRINAAPHDYERILRTLQVQMSQSPNGSLDRNGLGMNNLLYMAVVLEHLKNVDTKESPLLLVEEPEAHLHPQLTSLLAGYLAKTTAPGSGPQTLVTTHSPTLAASIPPGRIHVLFTDPVTRLPSCGSLAQTGMNREEQRSFQRMMDVTRASLYFAKGAILVEGICEALLIPALARRLGIDLEEAHISVIPICGVAFEVFKKFFGPDGLAIPVAIVSDSDPAVNRRDDWTLETPETDQGIFRQSHRIVKLLGTFAGHPHVKVFPSQLTLEYDLAQAGPENAMMMAVAWESSFAGTPRTFNTTLVSDPLQSTEEKALTVWRGICRADHSGSKADFAHQLADLLVLDAGLEGPAIPFVVPPYIKEAIQFVVASLPPPQPALQ